MSLNERDRIWQIYLDEAGHQIPTGGGIGRTHAIAAQDPQLYGRTPHNDVLWLAISVGVVGVILVALAWYVAFRARVPWVMPQHRS